MIQEEPTQHIEGSRQIAELLDLLSRVKKGKPGRPPGQPSRKIVTRKKGKPGRPPGPPSRRLLTRVEQCIWDRARQGAESEPIVRTVALAFGLLGDARANGGKVQEVRDPPTPLEVLVNLLSLKGATTLISRLVETGGEPAEVLEAGLLLLGEGGGLRRFQEWKRSGILGLPADPVETERVLEKQEIEEETDLTDQQPEKTLTRSECARKLGVSIRTVSRFIERGALRAFKFSPGQQGRVRVTETALQEFLSTRPSAEEKND